MSEKKTPTLSASQYLEQRIDEFKQARHNTKEKTEKILALFNYIVVSVDLDKKYYFDKVYNLDKKDKLFADLDKKNFGIINQGHLELLDWLCEKQIDNIENVQDYYQANIQLIKKCHKVSMTEYLINRNLSSLQMEEFKEYILKPFFALSPKTNYQNISTVNIPEQSLFILMSYLDKYLEKENIFDEIKLFNPEVQTQIVNMLISRKWFDYQEVYLTLKDYIEELESGYQVKIYNKIFEKEKNIDFLKLFEHEFKNMFQENNLNLSYFGGALSNENKRNYIVDTFIKEEKDLNRVIDCVLIGQSQNKNKNQFNDFIHSYVKNHLTDERKLNINQFCIMIKRCYDFGQFDAIEELLQTLKEKDSPMFKELHNKLQSKPIITMYGTAKLDFTKEPIQKFINYLFNKHLNDELEEKSSSQRNIKI